MTEKEITIFPGMNFGLVHSYDEQPHNDDFKLHSHDNVHEIVLFVSGDAEFRVEGNVYSLHPYDMVLTRPFEMHHIVCLSQKPYDRFILYITPEYFERNHCREFEAIFTDRLLGTNNLISREIVQTKLFDSFQRIITYSDEKAYIAANGVLTEFLYLLNKTISAIAPSTSNDKRISDIIMYINKHLSERITLDFLADTFYIDKYHLCKIFKKNTGYTLTQYINHKRILLVRQLYANGQTLLEASINAGFHNYSHFYRLYTKEMGTSPKNML